MMSKILPIVVVIVIAGIAVFIWQSGFLGTLGSLHLAPAPDFSNFGQRFGPSGGIGPTGAPIISPSSGGGAVNTPSPYIPPAVATSEIPDGFTRSELSPYFHKVTISSAYAGGGYAGSYGQITLYANMGQGESIHVTGWTLKGNRGSEYLPQAVGIYDPSGLTAPSDIVFHAGDQLTLYSTVSPIGENLRMNKCIGYLENTEKFNPPLSTSCPAPYLDANVSSFSGPCQNFIRSLGNCALPPANPLIPVNDYACQDFVNTINYRGCFDRHRSDSDFLSNQWIVWTGSNFLDSYHDRVLLLDKNGLVVSTYTY